MITTRAEFIRLVAAASAVAATARLPALGGKNEAAGGRPLAHPPGATPAALRALPETFRTLQNRTFWIVGRTGQNKSRLMLETVTDRASGPHTVQFSLLFSSPDRAHLPEGTYSVIHPQLGRIDLFLTPVMNPERKETGYRADYNLLLPAAAK